MPNVDMESGLPDKHVATSPVLVPVYIPSRMGESDEIGLADLWCVITRRKEIVLASILASVLIAVIYLFFAEPLYKANAYLLPPQQQKIQGLLIDYRNIEGIDVTPYLSENVFSAFLDNLNSQGLRREFFDSHELIKHYAAGKSTQDINADHIFEKLFNNRLKVKIDRQNASFVTVSFSDSNPEMAAQWVNQVIDLVNKRTVQQLVSNVNAAIQSEIDKTRTQIGSKLKLAEQRRLDTVIVLKEALRVARELGIEGPGLFSGMSEKDRLGLIVNTTEAPLYARGIKALETEISVLEARKSDEPFVSGFRDLQERLAFLEGTSINADLLSAVTIDAAARTPYRVERPRKLLLISIATALGLFVGMFLVFATEFGLKVHDGHEKSGV